MDVKPMPALRLTASYSYLELQVRPKADLPGQANDGSGENNPRHQFQVRSSVDLPAGISLDAALRHVGRLPGPMIPSYTSLDARLAWQASPRVEVAVVGQNLLDDHHPEFSERPQMQRGVYGRATLRW